MREIIALAALNMLVVSFVCCPAFEAIWDYVQGSDRLSESDEWSWREELLWKLPVHAAVAEVWFYFAHLAMHRSPSLYRHVHRIHHRFSAPTAMACVYAHPLEFAVCNILPIYLGCMLTNAHPTTCYGVWFPLAMMGTCKGHCGYQILGLADPHDAHHVIFSSNYGGMALLDRVFGTYQGNEGTKV
jgi:methylsterol monooxygenase